MAGQRDTIRDPSRRQRLASILKTLGDSEPGREFGLHRLGSLADFQASVPLHSRERHAQRVTARLGFGAGELDPELLSAAGNEREDVLGAWRQRMAGARPSRVVLLHARADDPFIDQIRLHDLQALAGGMQLLRIEAIDADPALTIERIHGFHPDTLMVPSLATCAWLEGTLRSPLERRFTSLRWLFAEHDLDERLRSRLPVLNAGWLHAAGRIGLPARRSPWWGFLLATNSTLIELLPHGDPELDPQAGRSSDDGAVLPEAAVLGDRYELVLSSPLGFLRLRSGLHVRVVGFAPPAAGSASGPVDSLPRLRVVRLPPPPPPTSPSRG